MLKIVKDSVPSLRGKCKEVELPLNDKDKQTLMDMLDYLKLSQDEEYRKKHPSVREGVGLAAPQVGVNKQMLVIYYPTGDNKSPYVELQLVNPRIISNSIKLCYLSNGEGCLSVDTPHKGRVYRYYKIKVSAYSLKEDKMIEISARGYDAIVLQHEIDHLHGILFYDHIDKDDPFKNIPGSIEI